MCLRACMHVQGVRGLWSNYFLILFNLVSLNREVSVAQFVSLILFHRLLVIVYRIVTFVTVS